MRAVVLDHFGSADLLELRDVPTPRPGTGEVLMRIVASGINPVDWKIRTGLLQRMFPHHFPLILGWEASGVIEATGEGASRFGRGDAVYAYTRMPEVKAGTYAEFIAVPESSVASKPASLFFHEAAAVPLAGLTAYQALFGEHQDVRAGATVLIHAAAGGVGHFAVQLAKHAGARVIGTAGASNLDFVKSLGVDHVIDYAARDFRDEVKALCPEGVQVVFDTVGGKVLLHSYDVVAKGGRLVGITEVPDASLAASWGFRAQYTFVSPSGDELRVLGELADQGKLRPHVSAMYALSQAVLAQQKSQQGHTRGKAVLLL